MAAEPSIEIAFDCLPLRSVGRLDVPLDASDELRHRAGLIQGAIEHYGVERTYYLQNAHCVFRFANSEIEGICRFRFEGVVRTDVGDRQCEAAHLEIRLVSETCGGLPEPVKTWLYDRVRQAVRIEFDRFLTSSQTRVTAGGPADHGGVEGLDV